MALAMAVYTSLPSFRVSVAIAQHCAVGHGGSEVLARNTCARCMCYQPLVDMFSYLQVNSTTIFKFVNLNALQALGLARTVPADVAASSCDFRMPGNSRSFKNRKCTQPLASHPWGWCPLENFSGHCLVHRRSERQTNICALVQCQVVTCCCNVKKQLVVAFSTA